MLKSVNMYYKKSDSVNKGYSGLIYDEIKHNNFITDSYSFIRLNNNNSKDLKRINDIKEAYGSASDRVKDTIVKYYENNVNGGFNILVKAFKDIKNDEITVDRGMKLIYIPDHDVYYDYNKIKRILNISDSKNAGLFISKENDKFLCITTKNSIAYLLCCKSY